MNKRNFVARKGWVAYHLSVGEYRQAWYNLRKLIIAIFENE